MNDNTNKSWETISTKVVYKTPFITVREDEVINPGGEKGIYSIVESKPGVLIIAINNKDEIYLIKTFRYPLQEWRWEIPGGGVDEGDTPLVAAQKELREELGLSADIWTQIGDMYPSNNGPLNDHNLIFVAQGLHAVKKNPESGEQIQEPKAIPMKEVFSMVRNGVLTDGQSLGALLLYKLWVEE